MQRIAPKSRGIESGAKFRDLSLDLSGIPTREEPVRLGESQEQGVYSGMGRQPAADFLGPSLIEQKISIDAQ